MRFDLTATGDLSRADRGRWGDLADAAVDPNPFYDPDFVMPAARAAGAEEELRLAVLQSDGEWVGALPLTQGRWRGRLPAAAGWRHPYGFLGTPLLRRDAPSGSVAELVSGILDATARPALVLEQLGDGQVADLLREAASALSLAVALDLSVERAMVLRRPDAAYLTDQEPKRRRELARQRRRLAELEGGEVRAFDVTDDQLAPARFLTIEAGGWKGSRGTAMASSATDSRMFTEVCERLRARGCLQLLELRAAERIVAAKCNLASAGGAFAFKIGFVDELARFSPGVQLELDNLEFFHEGGSRFMDSCASPDNEMINRLWPDRRRISTLVLTRPGLKGTAARAALGVAGRLKRSRGSDR